MTVSIAFSPRHAFAALYRETCYRVCKGLVLADEGSDCMLLPSAFANLVEDEMVVHFGEYRRLGSSMEVHRNTMRRHHEKLSAWTSDDTCFVCIRQRPQFTMPCGHSVDQNCVKIFGSESETDPWLFRVDKCFLCLADTAGLSVRVKPSTASVRVLSIDGGGTRGRVALESIQALQDRVGLPYPVQRNFDVIYGTSSGIPVTPRKASGVGKADSNDSYRCHYRLCALRQPMAHRRLHSRFRQVSTPCLPTSNVPLDPVAVSAVPAPAFARGR